MKETVVHSYNDLQTQIFSDVWNEKLLRYRDNRVYRGMADVRWTLEPALNRACPHDLTLERQILRSFRKYGYADLESTGSFWQIAAMGQQFGLPTRLLDWTYSPLVAAHFATEDIDLYDRDGVIWRADVDRINQHLPKPLRELLTDKDSSIFTMGMLDQIGGNYDALSAFSDQPYAFFFEPASTVNRIANQYALFSLTTDPAILIDRLPGLEDCFEKIVIPKEIKLEVRDKLDYINISERMIYPGLDGICKWITRRYANLGPQYNAHRSEEKKGEDSPC
ncbi:MAG: FRG domain-containing protein [Clostridia bacterium]|nr:FRG domain-containing protein [Clostridia bacterium]